MSEQKPYDVIIVGAGPAGMTASIYTARANMKTLVIEKVVPGGQMFKTQEIENYPGFSMVFGPDLSQKMFEQAKKFGANYLHGYVKEIRDGHPYKTVIIDDRQYQTKTVIIATGAEHRKLGIPGEEKFSGLGVSYCAVCDGAFFTDLELVVIGGGDSAVEEALYLTRFASKVTIIHRRDKLRAHKNIQKKAFENKKISFIWNHLVKEIRGADMVSNILIKDNQTGEESEYPCKGAFIYVGMDPNFNCVKGLKITNDIGYIPTDNQMQTKIAGIFAIGDIREKTLRQVVTATGDGSIAALSAQHFVENLDEEIK